MSSRFGDGLWDPALIRAVPSPRLRIDRVVPVPGLALLVEHSALGVLEEIGGDDLEDLRTEAAQLCGSEVTGLGDQARLGLVRGYQR